MWYEYVANVIIPKRLKNKLFLIFDHVYLINIPITHEH